MTEGRLNPLLDVHLKGAFFVTRPAWKVMRQKNFGRIVNTCSAVGILGAPRMSNYGAAKTGLIGLTRVLAAEAAGPDIKIMRSFRSPPPDDGLLDGQRRRGRQSRG